MINATIDFGDSLEITWESQHPAGRSSVCQKEFLVCFNCCFVKGTCVETCFFVYDYIIYVCAYCMWVYLYRCMFVTSLRRLRVMHLTSGLWFLPSAKEIAWTSWSPRLVASGKPTVTSPWKHPERSSILWRSQGFPWPFSRL